MALIKIDKKEKKKKKKCDWRLGAVYYGCPPFAKQDPGAWTNATIWCYLVAITNILQFS